MKTSIVLLLLTVFSFGIQAQTDDLPIDESIITRVAKIGNKGYLSRTDAEKAVKLDVDEKDATVVSFTFSFKDGAKMIDSENKGADFSEMIKTRFKEAKIGTKFYFKNIVIENASGTVKARDMVITIKS